MKIEPPNFAPAPNRRQRSPLGSLEEFEYRFGAPPSSPAAVGEARRFASHMKALIFLRVTLAATCCSTTALSNSYDMPLAEKIRSLPVVAEVRIERVEVRPDPPNKFD
jgi:hypothetical protein